MADEPDIYADSFSFTVTNYGCTLTLYLSHPTDADALAGRQTVGRIRLGHVLAQELGLVIAANVHAVTVAEPTGTPN